MTIKQFYLSLDWTLSNRQLSEQLKRPIGTIAAARQRYGIPKTADQRSSPARRAQLSKQTSAPRKLNPSLLGTMPDKQLAQRLGMSRDTIRHARVARRIKPYGTY